MSDDDHSYDVLVCGGGPGGLAAAVSAARNGADTLLVERYGFLGGMATAGLVNPFMTYYAGDEQIIEGVFEEILDRLRKYNAYVGPRQARAFDPEMFKIVADEMCLESGVKLLLHSFACDAHVKDSRIESVEVMAKPEKRNISAKLYIDATGDADVAYYAGVPCEKGRESDGLTQPMTLCFNMAGVDFSRMLSRKEVGEVYVKAREQGRVDCPRENVLFFFTMRDGEVHFNTTRIIREDGTDAASLTAAEIESRRQMMDIVRFMKREIPGFENAYLQLSATQIGVRESRRIVGEYVMNVDDVLGARKFDDVIARGSYCIDIHNPDGSGTVIRELPPGESYDIPYRSIIPLKVDNLLVAGRPISSTHEAHSSIRIMPIAVAIGQAAGTAAALCSKKNSLPRELDINLLQSTLISQGANLGAHVNVPEVVD